MTDSLDKQEAIKQRSQHLILFIVLATLFVCILVFLLVYFFLTRNLSLPTTVKTEYTNPTQEASSEWLEYRNTRYGFTILYPDMGLTPSEVDVFEKSKTDYLYCDTGIPACPSFVEEKYKIAFVNENSQEVVSVQIFDEEISIFEWDGKVNDGFTYNVVLMNRDNSDQDLIYNPINEQVRIKMHDSIKFIDREKPKTCLWTEDYVSYTKEESDLLRNDVYAYIKLRNGDPSIYGAENKKDEPRRYSGWMYNWGGDCEEIEFYTWSEYSSGPPFNSREECSQTCLAPQ